MDQFYVSINGEIFNGADAKISVFDRGFLYGDSVYEATRTFNQKPFRLSSHLERLFESAQKLDFTPELTRAGIEESIEKLIQHSQFKNALIRLILTRGTNRDLGLDPSLSLGQNLIIFTKEIKENPASWLSEGVEMIFYKKTHHMKGSLPKTGDYRENLMANKAALAKNAYDAIMVSPEGHVTECTTANIWVIFQNQLITPPLGDGVLEGLTRKALFEMMTNRTLGLTLVEKSLTEGDILSAEECFMTSTTRNLLPITSVDGKKIGLGVPGPKTLALLKEYLSFVSV
jgi:branched-chain amino acid aminotransferase